MADDETEKVGPKFPYKCEYAKSGRAGCKKCKEKIAKDSLRIAIMVRAWAFDGFQPNWHHGRCFLEKITPTSIDQIEGFHELRPDDQKKLKLKIGESGGSGGSVSKSGSKATLNNFCIQYAKSAASKCRKCENCIEKDEIRVSYKEIDIERAAAGMIDKWHHLGCFIKIRPELTIWNVDWKISQFSGFSILDKADKAQIKEIFEKADKKLLKKLEKLKKDENKVKKEAGEDLSTVKAAETLKKEAKSKKMLENQSKIIWKTKDALKDIPKNAMMDMLLHNKQDPPDSGSVDKFLDRVIDGILFGALEKCDSCKGQLVATTYYYKCTGFISGYTACDFKTVDPQKIDGAFKIGPAYLVKKHPVLAKIKMPSKSQTRVFPSEPESTTLSKLTLKSSSKRKLKSESEKSPKKSKSATIKLVNNTAVDPESGLSEKCHVYKPRGSKKPYTSTMSNVDVEQGINSYYKVQMLKYDDKKKYAVFRSWGRVGSARIGGTKISKYNSEGAALDEFLEVYQDKTGNSFLSEKQIKKPRKFFPLEIDYGDEKSESGIKSENGVKTENGIKTEIRQKSDSEILAELEKASKHKSKLDTAIQELMMLIFDLQKMKNELKEYELDLDKMPLGKISKNQIKLAYSILKEAIEFTKSPEYSKDPDVAKKSAKVTDFTNKFYTMIPHDTGMGMGVRLGTSDIIQKKCDMMEMLMDMERAMKVVGQIDGTKEENVYDQHYSKLECGIKVLDKENDCRVYEVVEKMVQGTHAETHDSYTLSVENIYSLDKKRESRAFKPYQKKLKENVQLLWHGSRMTNYAGILSSGLRIAPPEAPVTGYMFGKGLYFADVCSKSANYCHHQNTDNTGFLLLCEVALGESWDKFEAENVKKKKIPEGKYSVKGVGKTEVGEYEVLDGYLKCPVGDLRSSGVEETSLLYNEFIVYDVDQVKMKYLVKLKFNQKTEGEDLW